MFINREYIFLSHLVLHAELDEGGGDQDGGTSQPGDAMHANAGFRLLLELL